MQHSNWLGQTCCSVQFQPGFMARHRGDMHQHIYHTCCLQNVPSFAVACCKMALASWIRRRPAKHSTAQGVDLAGSPTNTPPASLALNRPEPTRQTLATLTNVHNTHHSQAIHPTAPLLPFLITQAAHGTSRQCRATRLGSLGGTRHDTQ